MSGEERELGIVGLGQIGESLALQALDKGFRVVGHDKCPPEGRLIAAGLTPVDHLAELCERLSCPRIVILYVPASPVVDAVLENLSGHLTERDIVVDGGNSYWGDSIRRHARLAKRGIAFVDLGTSGGIEGARHGACFMAGGTPGL